MFKPFVVIATCCETILRMKTPGQFTYCDCGEVAVDAGDGFIHRTLGDTKHIHYVKDKRDADLLMHWNEVEASIEAMMGYTDLSKFNVDGCRDIHSLISKRTGLSRQDAKDLLYMYNYTQNTGIKDILFRARIKGEK